MNFISILISLTWLLGVVCVDWTQLQNIIASGELALLSRSDENLQRYLELKNDLKDQGMTMPDYVKEKIFGFKGQPKHSVCQVSSMAIAET
jgi:hypothetical protein